MVQALPPWGHGQPWDVHLGVSFGELPCSPTPAASQVMAPCGMSTSNQVKPALTSTPGGHASDAPITRAALAMGGLP